MILDYFAYYDGEKLAAAKNLSSLFDTRRLNIFRRNISQDNYGMYKINSSFQFFENYFQNEPSTNSNNIPTYILVKVPRQIDLETGQVY